MAQLPARRPGRVYTLADPNREFEDIYERMGQLINFAFGGTGLGQMTDAPWVPLADLSETDDAFVIEVDMPGVSKDQLHVELNDRELIISGEITQKEKERGRLHRRSRRTGRFEYRTLLPGDINPEGVSAQLSDGVLKVTVPKSEAAKPRSIEITG